jgi:Tfp pilus assembly protein PilZ
VNKRIKALRYRKRVEVQFNEPGATMRYTAYTGNISRTGIMLRTPRVFGAGSILEMEIRFPEGAITVRGRVKWAREGSVMYLSTGRVGMGLVFVDPPEELFTRLGLPAAAHP